MGRLHIYRIKIAQMICGNKKKRHSLDKVCIEDYTYINKK